MPQVLIPKVKGRYTSANSLSAVPEGALDVASNIVIDENDLARPRRGFERLAAGFATSGHRAKQLAFFQGMLFAHTSADQLQYTADGSAWSIVPGSLAKPTNAKRVRFAEGNQNLYVTSSAGLKKLDAYNATPVAAGAVKALDLQASIPGSVTSAWLLVNERVTYRLVWGYKDTNGNLVRGAPSQRESIRNTTGAACDVQLVATIPDGVTTSWFYQLYRSVVLADAAGDLENSDELALVYEANPTAGEITAKSVTILDIVPDALRGETIYTAPSQGGIALQNEQPPLASDITVFRGCLIHFDIVSKHRFYLSLVAAGGTAGVQVDDTLTVGGVTYTGKTVETVASAQFRVHTTGSFTFVDADVNTGTDTITEASHGRQNGDPVTLSNAGGALPGGLAAATTYFVRDVTANTFKLAATLGGAAVDITSAAGGGTHTLSYGGTPAQNIRDTALSLVRVINRYASSTVYAYYLSGVDDLPGKILLEERSIGGSSFAATSSRATCWNPALPSSGTAQSSTNDADPAGVAWSKAGEIEAVPLPYRGRAGSKAARILRALALRDAVFILKEDGIWKLTGTGPSNFAIEPFDSSTKLLAPESCAVLGNQLYCLTDQGVVAISETGVPVVSPQIESDLKRLIGLSLSQVAEVTFGTGYESDRRYILWTISTAGDQWSTIQHCYNAITGAWTTWDLTRRCAIVSPADDKLYAAEAQSQFIQRERKAYDETDQVDHGFETTITAVSGDQMTVTLGSQFEDVAVGDVISQADDVFGIVTARDPVTSQATLSAPASFTVAAATVLKAIATEIRFAPITAGNAAQLKHWHQVTLLFESDISLTAELGFVSDLDRAESVVSLAGADLGNWGFGSWGEFGWGGENGVATRSRWVPRQKAICSQLSVTFRHAVGYSDWQLAGIAVAFNPASERVGR